MDSSTLHIYATVSPIFPPHDDCCKEYKQNRKNHVRNDRGPHTRGVAQLTGDSIVEGFPPFGGAYI